MSKKVFVVYEDVLDYQLHSSDGVVSVHKTLKNAKKRIKELKKSCPSSITNIIKFKLED